MKLRKVLAGFTAAALLCTASPLVFAKTDAEDVSYDVSDIVLAEEDESAVEAEVASSIETETEAEAISDETVSAAATYPYQDTSLSFEERAADLVSRMTLEEKVNQLLAKGSSANAISRLGVHSYYYWREGIHGVARQGVATSFPSSLAMSNTWNTDLIYSVMDVTSTEARGKNNRYDLNYWNPTINLARDPRWGRNEESYGEDPYLTGQIGISAIEGMQGTDEKYIKTIATLKHYLANNNESERQTGSSVMNDSTLREYYTRAFRDIVENTNVGAVMTSYNGLTIYKNGELVTSLDGQLIDYIASSANTYTNKDLLMRTFGYSGFLVGDCGAWDNAYGRQSLRQKLYPDEELSNITAPMTAAKIMLAGSNLDCNSGNNGASQVLEAVETGLISEDLLDTAVYDLFLQRMRTGEFDDGAMYQDITSAVLETDEHVAIAEEAAEESWVLLENDGTLPLSGEEVADTSSVYAITDAEYTDDNTLSVSYVNNTDYVGDAMIIAATYEDSSEAVMTGIASAALDGTGTQSLSLTKSGVTKVFIIKDTDSIEPLSLVKTVGKATSTGALDIAVIGELANEVVLGDYSGEPTKTTTPLEGITAAVQELNSDSTVTLLGSISDSTPLFNVKSITLVKSTGKNTTLDLSAAKNVTGMTVSDGQFTNVTKSAFACIENVDFSDVTDIQIEAASFTGMPNTTVTISYETASQPAASVEIGVTSSSSDYITNTGTYNGATGGYTGTANLYFSVSASADFSVENYSTYLDKADYIIAYGGTTTADSGESNDRESIDLPTSQSHVQQVCDAYPKKTIVVLQTVGQVNVEDFKDKCAALLWTSYNGQTQGEALGKILTGEANPSGKLSTTWYKNEDLEKMPIGSSKTSVNGVDYNYTNYELSGDIYNESADYPGRTYQYYTGDAVYDFGYGMSYTDFEYSNIKIDKTSVDANDTVTVSVDVTNTGDVSGKEVVQLYISVPGADGKTYPLKQLKGFEKISLEAGETQTVSLSVDVSDVYFYDEANSKNYVVNGEYTAYMCGSSDTSAAQSVTFNVSGTIAQTLKNVTALPSGIVLYNAQDSTGTYADTPGNSIDPNLSVLLKDDTLITDFASNGVTLSFASSNTNVANVDAEGIVTAGATEGTATITVTASKSGSESVTTSFPVVTQNAERLSDSDRVAYTELLDAAYSLYVEAAYTTENWAELTAIYNEANDAVTNAVLEDGLALMVSEAIEAMAAIPKIELTESYTIASVNSNIIVDNRIEYDENGIGTMTVTSTGVSGSITESNPAEIALAAYNGSTAISSDLVWSVERLDDSTRADAEIGLYTGTLKLYTNGVYKITANDYANEKCGSIIVYANLQIEGEDADEGNGANLSDANAGASGGLDAGSTSTYWLRFDGVKLSRLTGVDFRLSKQSSESTVYVSLLDNTDWVIAEATAPVTASSTTWAEVSAEVDRNELSKLTLDDYGCGSIYVQTNGASLDYITFEYDNSDIDAYCLTYGRIAANVSSETGTLTATVNGSTAQTAEITGAGNYVLTGFSEGDSVTLTVTDESGAQVGAAVSITYNQPSYKKLTVYNFSDSIFDSFFDTAEGDVLTSGLGMDGDGGWNTTTKSTSYTYNGRTYKFTRALKGGSGSAGKRRVYFTPEADGAVTVIFNASTDRMMNIEQNGNKISAYGTGSLSTVQLNVVAGETVYVYGGGSNKDLYAVIFEADTSVIEVTPEPTATAAPTVAPLPDIVHEYDLEFEDYTYSWTTGANKNTATDATTGSTVTMIENTRDGDIFYFGTQTFDNLEGINVNAAIRTSAGTATVSLYALDTSGIDFSSATKSSINALLTSDKLIGSVTLIDNASSWATYYDNQIRLGNTTGQLGMFIKLNTTGSYCGNFNLLHMMYSDGSSSSASVAEYIEAENETSSISIDGNTITYTEDGESSTYDYAELSGKNVTFLKVVDWNGSFTALAKNNDSGKNEVIGGTSVATWGNISPVSFSEKDADAPSDPVINDMVAVGDQLYLGCDGGYVITMTPCDSCSTMKKVCGFDIKSISYENGAVVLKGEDCETSLDLSSVRQTNISAAAALELYKNGAILVDVRSAAEYAEKSYDGSINVPVDEFADWLSTQDGDTVVIVYCASGVRASKAVDIAEEQGFEFIYNLGSIDNLL